MDQPARRFRFGSFEFDPVAGELTRAGRIVRLEPQPARALGLLLEHAGTLVLRDTIKTTVWGDDVHVDFDRGLTYCIGQIRTALSDSAENPRFIETLPRRGFKFIAPVEVIDLAGLKSRPTSGVSVDTSARAVAPASAAAVSPAPWWRGRHVAIVAVVIVAGAIAAAAFKWAGSRPVLAVAVFDNETKRPEYDTFTAGLPDALIVHLGKLGASRLGVIGNARALRMPRSTRDLDTIKRETGAGFILIGQVQLTDTGFRVVTHLIRLDDGLHLWVNRFDRKAGDFLGLEAEVAAGVDVGVRMHVTRELPAPPRTDGKR